MNSPWLVVDACGQAQALMQMLASAASSLPAPQVLAIGDEALARDASHTVADVTWIDTGGEAADAYVEAAAQILQQAQPCLTVTVTTPALRNVVARTAVALDAPIVSDAVGIATKGDGADTASFDVDRSILDDRIIQTVSAPAPLCVLAKVFVEGDQAGEDAPADASAQGTVHQTDASPSGIELVAREPKSASKLTEADRIVSVGRGVGSQEAIEGPVAQLAAKLDAEMGCSMPVADELFWMPHESYIGWSGLRVAPKFYLALGISGMPQHLAGVRNAQTIVCINHDAHAPFFKFADYGIVGEIDEVVAELNKQL
jgi:electron transfer flavoprotein alpha subunit